MRPLRDLRRNSDRGSISILAATAAFAVIIMIGLAVDGGGKVRAAERADYIAQEAARAAGQAINTPQAIQGGPKILDPNAAVAAGQHYLAVAGVTGTVTVSKDLTHVTVTVTITAHTVFLELIGISQFTVTRHATAVLITT